MRSGKARARRDGPVVVITAIMDRNLLLLEGKQIIFLDSDVGVEKSPCDKRTDVS
jgi:hypothetical protein